jgi:major membrane immunogen (membrane-anchored lipoprotein)
MTLTIKVQEGAIKAARADYTEAKAALQAHDAAKPKPDYDIIWDTEGWYAERNELFNAFLQAGNELEVLALLTGTQQLVYVPKGQ